MKLACLETLIDITGKDTHRYEKKSWHQVVPRVKRLYSEWGLDIICDALGYSCQAYYKHLKTEATELLQNAIVVKMLEELYGQMPRLGARKLYHMLKLPMLLHYIDIGRDKLFAMPDDMACSSESEDGQGPLLLTLIICSKSIPTGLGGWKWCDPTALGVGR